MIPAMAAAPGPARWAMLGAYLFAAALCFAAARRPTASRQEPNAWLLLTGLLVFLGIARILDVTNDVSDAAREIIRELGLYGGRRPLQVLMGLMLMAIGVAATISLWRAATRRMAAARVSLCAALLLVFFWIGRSVSLHAVDRLLGKNAGGISLNAAAEVVLLVAISFGALRPEQK